MLFRKKQGDDETAEASSPDVVNLPEGAATQDIDLANASDHADLARDAETSESEAAQSSTASHPLFKQLEPLTAERHGHLSVARNDNGYAFARDVYLAPLVAEEFPQAARSYPIIFAGPKGRRVPCAAMGLRPGANLFIRQDGALAPGAYAPAHLRQAPFLLAKDKDNDRSVLLIDRASEFVVEGQGFPLFDDGDVSAFTQETLKFLANLQAQRAKTQRFAAHLEELGLLMEKELKLVIRGDQAAENQTRPVVKYVAVDKHRLNALAPDVLKQLIESGAMMAIYAHLLSLYNWSSIVSRAFAAQRAAA